MQLTCRETRRQLTQEARPYSNKGASCLERHNTVKLAFHSCVTGDFKMQNDNPTFDSLSKEGWHLKDEVRVAKRYESFLQHNDAKAAAAFEAGEREAG